MNGDVEWRAVREAGDEARHHGQAERARIVCKLDVWNDMTSNSELLDGHPSVSARVRGEQDDIPVSVAHGQSRRGTHLDYDRGNERAVVPSTHDDIRKLDNRET